MAKIVQPVEVSAEFLCVLVRRRDLPMILQTGYLAPDNGGTAPLGSVGFLRMRADIRLPPPFRAALSSYAALRFTPLTPSTYAVLTGYDGAEELTRSELLFLVTTASWLARLGAGFLFTDLGLASRRARIFTDLCRLDVIDRDRLAHADFDARKDAAAPHRSEAEFLVWAGLPPRGILEIICHDLGSVASVESEVAAAGRGDRITVRADPSFFFKPV